MYSFYFQQNQKINGTPRLHVGVRATTGKWGSAAGGRGKMPRWAPHRGGCWCRTGSREGPAQTWKGQVLGSQLWECRQEPPARGVFRRPASRRQAPPGTLWEAPQLRGVGVLSASISISLHRLRAVIHLDPCSVPSSVGHDNDQHSFFAFRKIVF